MKRTEGEIEVASDDMLTVIYSANMDFSFPAKGIASREVKEANAEHITALWNASKDMTTEEAIAILKHGTEIEKCALNARRTFLCVEACKDLDDEQVASGLMNVHEAMAEYDALNAQLREAMALLERCSRILFKHEVEPEEHGKIQAFLIKLKGDKQS